MKDIKKLSKKKQIELLANYLLESGDFKQLWNTAYLKVKQDLATNKKYFDEILEEYLELREE